MTLLIALFMLAPLALAYWVGLRVGRTTVVRDELLARRRRPAVITGAPTTLLHMASFGIEGDVEAVAEEAFAILRGDDAVMPNADHLAALAIYHEDAVRHYDQLGEEFLALRRRFTETENGRNALARFIRREIEQSAAVEQDAMGDFIRAGHRFAAVTARERALNAQLAGQPT